jgi:hypothetical protein
LLKRRSFPVTKASGARFAASPLGVADSFALGKRRGLTLPFEKGVLGVELDYLSA